MHAWDGRRVSFRTQRYTTSHELGMLQRPQRGVSVVRWGRMGYFNVTGADNSRVAPSNLTLRSRCYSLPPLAMLQSLVLLTLMTTNS